MSLARAIDRGLDEAAAVDLWRQARGSPFWLEALARGRGADDPSSLVGERLRMLSSDAGSLLAALAVAARPFLVDDVARVLGWEIDRIREASRELIARALALESAGSLRLAHDLIREAAIDGLPSVARRRRHALLADWIEAGAGHDLQMLCEALEHRDGAGLPAAALASRVLSSPHCRLLSGENLRVLASIGDALEPRTPEQVGLDDAIGELAALLGEQELGLGR